MSRGNAVFFLSYQVRTSMTTKTLICQDDHY